MPDKLLIILFSAVILIGLLKTIQKRLSVFFKADTITVMIQVVSVLFLAPWFIWIDFDLKLELFDISLVILAGFAWYLGSLVASRSIQEADLTLREPIVQTRTVFVLLLSLFVLGERPTFSQMIGAILVFTGAIISSYNKGFNISTLKSQGAILCLYSSMLIAVSYTIDKYGLGYIDYFTWSFLMFLIPGIFISPKIKFALQDIRDKSRAKVSALACFIILNSIAYLLLIYIFSRADLSVAYPLSQLSSIIVFLGGLYLGERNNIKNRSIGAIVSLLGGALIYSIK